MRDGVVLRVNVYRPRGSGPFPVILSVHPYGKNAVPTKTRRGWKLNVQFRIMNQSEQIQISDLTGWEAPDPVWWVAQGYAVINADERGAGTSDGTGSLFTDAEATDSYDLIQRAGAQPWSNGNVGMLGVSYLAISQYKAAALHPPSLKAICPWEGFSDIYRDFMTPGGVAEKGFSRIWQAASKRVARISTDFRLERRRRPLRDSWWDSLTPSLDEITVPMLVCASFSDANLHTVGSFRALQRVGSAERFAYLHRGPKWSTFYSAEAKAAQLAFFDRYLRESDTPTSPRVRLEVRESHDRVVEVRTENEWPLARTEWTELHLADDGRLTEAPGPAGKIEFDLRRDAAAFTFTFTGDTELTGPMNLKLWASLDGHKRGGVQDGRTPRDANLFIGVEKWSDGRCVPFEGSYGYGRDRVATGRLRMSMRELDPATTFPHQPEHAFLTQQLLAQGEIVQLDIPLSPSSTLFRAGDSLRLLVAGRYLEPLNPLFGHFPARYASSPRGRCTLHWDAEHPARLEIPVIPKAPRISK
ncbi:CocE/NonD family hydrolase [Arthrobacter sp. E3]|uniref:CocE/NonD family hydrolase n=1 Tax=Arthrobacter sp. E3 TaxID=517402 RepID=UPI001A943FAA|nr:CocE/NonD family hydrolase [Arthrobacter sp. E3]